MRRALLLAVLAGALVAPASAGAHATIVSTSPERGQTLKSEPAQVLFHFDESVEGNFGAVRVFDAKGDRVDANDASHPGGAGDKLAVHLKPGLPDGTYTATYRVVSADGHIVSSGLVFSIGKAGAAGRTIEELLGGAGPGRPAEIAFGAARALQYGSIAVGGGALLFLVVVWLPALLQVAGGSSDWERASRAFVARLRVVLLIVALVGACSALAGVVLEAAEAGGISFWSALRPSVVREVLGTRFGTTWTGAAGAWLVLGLLTGGLLAPSRRRAPVLRPASLGATGLALPAAGGYAVLGLLAIPAGALLALPALSGHGSTQSPVAVLFPVNVLHVAAMAAWLGGLVTLLATVPAATRLLPAEQRTRLLAGALRRFSPLALGAVAVLLITGLIQSYVEIRHLDLIFSTPFGRAAFIKLILLLALIGLGALNRQRTVPALRRAAERGATPGGAGALLRRTLRAEVALIVVVLGVTGALASYAPATAQQSGPVSRTTHVGPQELQMTVDPARVGSNEVHLYLTDPKTGAQFDGAKEVDVTAALASKSLGPLPLQADKSGPGHYTIAQALLNLPGEWTLKITVRVSEFDEYDTTVKVPIR